MTETTTWRVFNCIKRSLRNGVAPSYQEIADTVGLAGVSTVSYHLAILEKRGLIKRKPGTPRHIQLVSKNPATVTLHFQYSAVVKSESGNMYVRDGNLKTQVGCEGQMDMEEALAAAYDAVIGYLLAEGCLNEPASVTITITELRVGK